MAGPTKAALVSFKGFENSCMQLIDNDFGNA